MLRPLPDHQRQLLRLAAGALQTAGAALATMVATIDGRLSEFTIGPDWSAHPRLEYTYLRTRPAPKNCRYTVAELWIGAGAHAREVHRATAATMRLLAGAVLIRRLDDAGRLELLEPGSTSHYRAGEKYGFLALKNSHAIVLYHLPPTPKNP